MPTSKPNLQRSLLSPKVGAILEFTAGEEKGRQVPLVYSKTVVGRKFGDVLVRDIKVSSSHISIEFKKDHFLVVDLDSSNGTFVEDKKIKEARIDEGDEIRIGLTAFKLKIDPELAKTLIAKRPIEVALKEGGLADLIEHEFIHVKEAPLMERTQAMTAHISESNLLLVAMSGPSKGEKFTLSLPSTVVGRTNADVNLKDPDVPRKHALIERQEGGQVILRDLASRNGTFVNDRKVSNCVLSKGDQIKMGQTVLVFHGRVGG